MEAGGKGEVGSGGALIAAGEGEGGGGALRATGEGGGRRRSSQSRGYGTCAMGTGRLWRLWAVIGDPAGNGDGEVGNVSTSASPAGMRFSR